MIFRRARIGIDGHRLAVGNVLSGVNFNDGMILVQNRAACAGNVCMVYSNGSFAAAPIGSDLPRATCMCGYPSLRV